jgi:DNA-binding XRE family transcriptional regulator
VYRGIGLRVRRHRLSQPADLATQRVTAKVCGMSRGAYTNLEAGRFRIQVWTLYRLASHFGVPVKALLP